jgi:hypothetical protein
MKVPLIVSIQQYYDGDYPVKVVSFNISTNNHPVAMLEKYMVIVRLPDSNIDAIKAFITGGNAPCYITMCGDECICH